jgi:hypothetical protein
MSKDCFISENVVWKRICAPPNNVKVVIVTPVSLIPTVLEEAHGHLLAGHDGLLKTKERILQSYFWPGMDKDIQDHLDRCHKCQLRKKNTQLPELLSPLPQCTEPNQRVHADLFGPLKTSEKGKRYILCMTDAFTKYVELVALPDKEAVTVASAFFNRWVCRYGVPWPVNHRPWKRIFKSGVERTIYPSRPQTFIDHSSTPTVQQSGRSL